MINNNPPLQDNEYEEVSSRDVENTLERVKANVVLLVSKKDVVEVF
jgi:hypothetical protein